MPHSAKNAGRVLGSRLVAARAVRNSATSKPMPPAPMIATVSPTGLRCRAARRGSSAPSGGRCRGSSGMRGMMPVASTTCVEARDQIVRADTRGPAARRRRSARAACGSSAASRRTPPCRAPALARLNWPPISCAASNSVTSWPRSAAVGRRRPARPGRRRRRRRVPCAAAGWAPASVSWQARGLTRQEAILPLEGVVEAGLVAADAGVDLVGAARRGLGRRTRGRRGTGAPSTPCRRRPSRAPARPRSGVLMRLVATSGIADLALQLPRHPGEGGARHHGRDGGDARLVPADAGVDDRRAGRLDRLRELRSLRPVLSRLRPGRASTGGR